MSDKFEQLKDQKYLNLESFRKNGESTFTPVWFVQDGDILYVRTIADSGKVKRIHRNKQVRVMACGQAGEPLGEWVEAQAKEAHDETTLARVRELLFTKYGPMVEIFEKQTHEKGLKYTVIKIV